MRFPDFFVEYIILCKSESRSIPFSKLPSHRKFIIFFLGIFLALPIFLLIIKRFNYISVFFCYLAIAVALIIYKYIDYKKCNLAKMLSNYYTPYSQNHMIKLKELLTKYRIAPSNSKKITLLLNQASLAYEKANPIKTIKFYSKFLYTIILPIIAFFAKIIVSSASIDELIYLAVTSILVIILIFILIVTFVPVIKDFIFWILDLKYYEFLISDLNQLLIFYSDDI